MIALNEPWRVDSLGPASSEIVDSENVVRLFADHGSAQPTFSPEELIRVVACVNALAGIPTEELILSAETDDDESLKTYMWCLLRIAIGAEAERVKRRKFQARHDANHDTV